MVVIEVEFDQEVWDKIWNKVKSYLDKDQPQIIQRICDVTLDFGPDLELFCRTNTRAIGEFPSVVALHDGSSLSVDRRLPFNPYHSGCWRVLLHRCTNDRHKETTIATVVDDFKNNCAEGTNFLRNEATDIVEFVISDSPRLHCPGIPPHIPVTYAMKVSIFEYQRYEKNA